MITLNYQIALTNVPFDNSYKNVMRFDTRSEQETFFNVSSLFSSDTPKVNFNVGSLMATNIVFDCAKTDNINELLNKNYCIVKDNSSNAGLDYYYYFITNAKQENENRISLSIELDIFQTYYIDLKFSDCLIERAHLDRWVNNFDGTVSFNGNVDSPLFEREPIKNVAKRMTKRTSVGIYKTGNNLADEWLNENILCWEYIYLSPDNNYTINKPISSVDEVDVNFDVINYGTFESEPSQTDDINYLSQICCICIPIYKKSDTKLFIQYGNTPFNEYTNITKFVMLDNSGLRDFLSKNGGNVFVYAIKLSYTPPFNYYTFYDNAEFINESNRHYLILKTNEATSSEYVAADCGKAYASNNYHHGFININKQYGLSKILKTKSYTISPELKFNILDIINDNKNTKYNPKLLGSDYFNLRLSDQTENGFNYDVQKLNQKDVQIQSVESLTPDISKRYISILSEGGVYIPENSQNLVGFISSNDSTLILATTKFQEMLANNKNFFLQNSINRQFDVAKGAISSVGQAFKGNFLGAISGAVNTGIDYAQSKINEDLTVDNLQNAPETIQGAKGNIVFELMYGKSGIIIEEWDILPHEKEIINDYMCMYGFTYNKIGNIKNFDNIRKYYNYIKADIEEVSSETLNVSDNVLQKFKRLFAQGVRFWNTNTFSYTKENYEKWFDDIMLTTCYITGVIGSGQYSVTYNNNTHVVTWGSQPIIIEMTKTADFNIKCANGKAFYDIVVTTDGTYTITDISVNEKVIHFENATNLTFSTSVGDYI